MNEKPGWPPIVLCWAITLGLVGLLTSQTIMASQQQSDESILSEIVSATVTIMRKHGHEMPNYRIIDGRADVPISGPGVPEKHAFRAYVDKQWLERKQIIMLRFYEADKIPLAGRMELINHLIRLHEKQYAGFALSLYMTRAKEKKPQIAVPEAFFLMQLNRIEH